MPVPTDTSGHGRGRPSWTRSGRPAGPAAGHRDAQARASAGPRFAPDAELELFLDMPDTRRTGRAGPPKNPDTVTIPPVPTLEHDAAYFDRLDAARSGRRADRCSGGSVVTLPARRPRRASRRRLDDVCRRPWTRLEPVELTVTQQHDLVDLWTTMLTDVYVHYAQKRALYGYDPSAALAALRRQIPFLDSAGFLRELTLIVNRLRDQHTQLYVDAAGADAHPLRRRAAVPRRGLRPATARRRTSSPRSPTASTTPGSPPVRGSPPGTACPSRGRSTCTPTP